MWDKLNGMGYCGCTGENMPGCGEGLMPGYLPPQQGMGQPLPMIAVEQGRERKERKYEDKEERRANREMRKEERREKREKREEEQRERRERREENKLEKQEKRGKEPKKEVANILEELPNDGNNMMFVASCLRNMTLHKNKRKVEQLLAQLALQFLGTAPTSIPKTTLVFDDTRAKSQSTVRPAMLGAQDTTRIAQEFELCSARPHWATSDDAIVEWVATVQDGPGIKLCVTSDRELMERIEQEGGRVMKPKRWMLLAASRIAGHEVTELDSWMSQWCDQQLIV